MKKKKQQLTRKKIKRTNRKKRRSRTKRRRIGGNSCYRTGIYLKNKIRNSKSLLNSFDERVQKDIVCKYPTKHFDRFLPQGRKKTCGENKHKPSIYYLPDWFNGFKNEN